MKQKGPSEKMKRVFREIAKEDPSLAPMASLFLYRGDSLFELEVLSFALNDIAPDSPIRNVADMIERLVIEPPSNEDWIKQENLAPIICPTPYSPAPGSPLYELNNFLAWNPCFLRIEGSGGASGDVEISATHIPLPASLLFETEILSELRDKAIESWTAPAGVDRILWMLWGILFQKIDLKRLKRCKVCMRWFVDRTKNRTKARCSESCTWQHWSWGARRNAGHSLPNKNPKARKKAPTRKRRGQEKS